MPASSPPEHKTPPRLVLPISLGLSLAILGIYSYLDLAGYLDVAWLKMLPDPWNDNVIYLLIILAAIPAAGLGFLLMRQFKVHEPQRRIWLSFACGWACWVLGEISGYIYHQIDQTLPDLTFSDLWRVLIRRVSGQPDLIDQILACAT